MAEHQAPVLVGEFAEGLTEQQIKDILINDFKNTLDSRKNVKLAEDINSYSIKVAYRMIGPGEADSCIVLLLEKESKSYIVDAVSQSTCLGFTDQFEPKEITKEQIPTFRIKTAWYDVDRKKNKSSISVALHEAFGLEPPEEDLPPVEPGTDSINLASEMVLQINDNKHIASEVSIVIPGGNGLENKLESEVSIVIPGGADLNSTLDSEVLLQLPTPPEQP